GWGRYARATGFTWCGSASAFPAASRRSRRCTTRWPSGWCTSAAQRAPASACRRSARVTTWWSRRPPHADRRSPARGRRDDRVDDVLEALAAAEGLALERGPPAAGARPLGDVAHL